MRETHVFVIQQVNKYIIFSLNLFMLTNQNVKCITSATVWYVFRNIPAFSFQFKVAETSLLLKMLLLSKLHDTICYTNANVCTD